MKKETFAARLKKAMDINNFKQSDLARKTNLDKTLINKYLSGVSEAGNDKLTILGEALGVSEVWLMGYDVPMTNNEHQGKVFDELEVLFKKHRDILTKDDEETMKFLIEKRAREIDEQNNDQ